MNSMNSMNITGIGISLSRKANKVIFAVILASLIFITPYAQAKHLHYEKEYQEAFCNVVKGTMEVELKDYTRVDCVTDTHAIEFDFAKKWAESVGQSLHYSLMTGKRAGIVLIMENPERETYYLQRVINLGKKYNIDVWTMTGLNKESIKRVL